MSTTAADVIESIGKELEKKQPLAGTQYLNEPNELSFAVTDEAIDHRKDNQPEEIVDSTQAQTNELGISEESLKQILDTQKQLEEVKSNLGAIVDVMLANRSYFSKASAYWGELQSWEKIAGGVIIIGAPFLAGLALNIGALLTISGIIGVTYTSGGFILEDHHNCTAEDTKLLKEGVFKLSSVLTLTINALNVVHAKFENAIAVFKEQNQKLQLNVRNLGGEVTRLTEQVELFIAVDNELKKSKNDLEKNIARLEKSAIKQEDVLKAAVAKLNSITEESKKSEQQLQEQMLKLKEANAQLETKIKKTNEISLTLQGVAQTLAGTVIEDEKQKQAFQEKLHALLDNKETSLTDVSTKIERTEQELAKVKEELKQSNEAYKELLTWQEKLLAQHKGQIDRQEQQVDKLEHFSQPLSDLLSRLGLHKAPTPAVGAAIIKTTASESSTLTK